MKKIIGVLLTSLAVFFNIDVVNADSIFNTFIHNKTGVCTLESSSASACNYDCKVQANTVMHGNAYFNFGYAVEYNNNVLSLGRFTYYESDGNGFPKEADGIKIINLQKTVVNGIPFFRYYAALQPKITITPQPNYFLKKGELKCRNIIPSVTVNIKDPTGLDATVVVLAQIEVDILTDPEEIKKDLEEQQKEEIDNTACGFLGSEDSNTIKLIKKIYNFIKIIIPVLIVALSIADFLKLLVTGKDDDMKKAINKLVKRIMIAIVFVLLPLIISLLINVSGISSQYSNMGDGMKTIFCIFG